MLCSIFWGKTVEGALAKPKDNKNKKDLFFEK